MVSADILSIAAVINIFLTPRPANKKAGVAIKSIPAVRAACFIAISKNLSSSKPEARSYLSLPVYSLVNSASPVAVADPAIVPNIGATVLPAIPPPTAAATTPTSPAIAAKSPVVGRIVGELVTVHLFVPPNSSGTL